MEPADAEVTWDFGYGTSTATGLSVPHIYTVAGNYTAKVTAKNPRSGTIATTTLPVVVADSSVLPGTLGTQQTKGIIKLGPTFDQVTVTSVLQLKQGDTVGNQTLTIKINGLTRTFKHAAVVVLRPRDVDLARAHAPARAFEHCCDVVGEGGREVAGEQPHAQPAEPALELQAGGCPGARHAAGPPRPRVRAIGPPVSTLGA